MRLLGNANWWMPAWLRRIVPEISEEGAQELEDYTVPAPAPAGAATAPALTPALAVAGATPAALRSDRTMELPVFRGPVEPSGAPRAAATDQTMVLQARPDLPIAPASVSAMGKAELVVSGDWDGVPSIPLYPDRPTRFGRAVGNEVQLPSLSVSRWHARIDHLNGQYVITDLGSANGVYVNGARIAPRPQGVALRPADHVVIGGYAQTAFVVRPL